MLDLRQQLKMLTLLTTHSSSSQLVKQLHWILKAAYCWRRWVMDDKCHECDRWTTV